jgi:membrane dipeptidase
MLIAYNRNNRLGGGCMDEDPGLSDYGRKIIDEMERVGMVLCCSHTGYRTAREALEYARRPVIFSHSNPRAMADHPRNIPDDLLRACARTGGVVCLSGIGDFLGSGGDSVEKLIRQIDYVANLIGPEHVGLGLDYVFDQEELEDYKRGHPESYPLINGTVPRTAMIAPESLPAIAEGLIDIGYTDAQVQGALGHNNLRVARQVWK